MRRCSVLRCRRVTRRPFRSWICTRHWRAVPPSVKAEKRASERAERKAKRQFQKTYAARGCRFTQGDWRALVAVRCRSLCGWLACVREATIAEMGAC
jgi:hypothetical protein